MRNDYTDLYGLHRFEAVVGVFTSHRVIEKYKSEAWYGVLTNHSVIEKIQI